MKNTVLNLSLSILLSIISFPAFSQNLVQNPGFESNLSGWSYWSNEGTGTATVVQDHVHSGIKASRVQYPGAKDWALTSVAKIPVTAGSMYELSFWAMALSISSEANCSVVLYDSKQAVVNWIYSRVSIDKNLSAFKQFTVSFVVPDGVKYIQPRFEGWGSCDLYVDDMSLQKLENTGISGDYTIENENIKAVIHLPVLSLDISDKNNSKTYKTGIAQFAQVDSVFLSNEKSIQLYAKSLSGVNSLISIGISLTGNAVQFKISGDSEMALKSDIKFPGIIQSGAGEYFVIPRGTGVLVPVSSSNPFGDFAAYSWKSTMPFVGVTNLKTGYMIVADDQWDASFLFEKPVGQNFYSFQLNQKPAKGKLSYNRTSYMVLIGNGYPEMCSWYRSHAEQMGYVKTFSQKRNENENVDKLIGAVDFWPLNLGMNVSFLRNAKLMGIDKAIWNLSGSWGNYNFSTLVDSINSLGYLSGRYDILTDVWPANSWGYRSQGYPDDVIVESEGGLKKGWLSYHNGEPFQGYYTCSQTHKAYAQSYISNDLAINSYNSRFIDVELASNLEECYSAVHPATRKQDAEGRNALLGYVKNDLSLVTGAEEAHDFAFQNVDYGEGTMTIIPATNAGYDWSQPLEPTDKTYETQNISPEMRIPLHGLVYHDVHIPTWYTGDGASKVPAFWDDKDLWNILYGSMPLFMPPSMTYWNTNLEKFITSYHLISAVTRNMGYSKMTSHEFLSANHKIQKTSFENGWTVVANFDSIVHDWNNMSLAPKGFYASGGTADEAFRLEINGKMMGGAFTGDRLFFNPYGNELSWKGLKSSQSVFVQKYQDYLLVSFIGKQNYLELKASELPFDVEEITKVTEYYTGSVISTTDSGDGWKKLTRPSGKSFFKFYYKAKATGELLKQQNQDFMIFPNPAHDLITIQKRSSDQMYFSIYNPEGTEMMKQSISGLKTQVNIGPLASGIYFLNLEDGGFRRVTKLVKW
jgi:hypothetical protein